MGSLWSADNRGKVTRLLVALPLLSLVIGAVAWLRYGLDMPWYDDWRTYNEGMLGSLQLKYLFRPVNDTLAPLGFALDALAQRYLDGNSIAYQFLSMLGLLGTLLALQWKLLRDSLNNSLEAAICFSLSALMLQPGSYWGLENLAYHQGVPLIFILLSLWILVASGSHGRWRGPVVALLALLAGFTYISGAFGALAAGVALLVVGGCCFTGDSKHELLRDGAWFTLGAAVAAFCQLYFAVLKAPSGQVSIPLAGPADVNFWLFALGKVARSLMLPPGSPRFSLAAAILICLATAAGTVWLVVKARARDAAVSDRKLAALFIPIAAMAFAYLMLVAAGRTNFRPAEIKGRLDVFTFGFTRFHFFWITLVWPWLAALAIATMRRISWLDCRLRLGGLIAASFLLALAMLKSGAYSHMDRQREFAVERTKLSRCMLEEVQKRGPVRCPGLVPPRYDDVAPDAYPGYVHARESGASFVRLFPLLGESKQKN